MKQRKQHLTVRMAWHDNNWNGKVCEDPESNTYCTGAHSLLSGRIEKKKNTEREQELCGQCIRGNFSPGEVPPCYWNINAFSNTDFEVEHHHAFKWVREVIPDTVSKYSVFTWPFKLSFVHTDKNSKVHGNYWPNLEKRIDNYIDKFQPGESIMFFYANYDNPVSADDMRYLLLGCSVISEKHDPTHFPFSKELLKRTREPKQKKKFEFGEWREHTDISMINFPTINWMLQFSHDPDTAVLLPYKEYVSHLETHPDSEQLLDDMKVIIEEESLIRGFKYVSMDIDDDKCLYLLYKLRKSIKKMQEHNQQVVKNSFEEEERRINELISKVWKKRGIYPSLNYVIDYFIEDISSSKSLSKAITKWVNEEKDLIKLFERILEEDIPKKLKRFEDVFYELSGNRRFRKYYKSLAKLSLFVLTKQQIKKIIKDKPLLARVEANPYVLYEEYIPDEDDLDVPDMQDEPIDVFKIDMGMIPDRKYIRRHRGLQNLGEDSPERVRSVIINYLWQIGNNGHCYDSDKEVIKDLYEHPLIYKNNIELDDEALLNLDEDYKSHFIEKLQIREDSGTKFFYLDVVRKSEKLLKKAVKQLISRPDHGVNNIPIEKYLSESLNELSNVIQNDEQKKLFTKERKKLYKNILDKSFFLLTGKPGSGKTHETAKVIEYLYESKEDVLVLAPTGKAALRLTENIQKNTKGVDITAKTIDKYIFENKFGWLYDDWDAALNLAKEDKLTVENLVIDESSMLDLNKLSLLFSIIRFTDKYPKRIILVGDENQLPPIGFGKPFHDIINFVQCKDKYVKNHYINLVSNCRQENDEKILMLAEAFTDKTRCYEEAFNIIDSGEGKKSEGLFVYNWRNKEELYSKIKLTLDEVFKLELGKTNSDRFKQLNLLFGLYENGNVNNQGYKFRQNLDYEKWQILTPYRTGYFGTLGINKLIQGTFRFKDEREIENKYFRQGDKIIRLSNWYTAKGENRKLKLSNGSMGIVNSKWKKNGNGQSEYEERKYYFKDSEYPMKFVDDEENFDLAYGISVHKSQGSDFRNVFLVVPRKQSLLSKELLYTALTRSKYRLFVFVQESDESLLLKAKNTSHLIHRNSSIFGKPADRRGKYSPEPGVTVASKIEFIIYQALMKSGLKFRYEKALELDTLNYKIHPDFTIFLRDGKKIFWEHLGMLDMRKYYNDWQDRRKSYEENGKLDILVTTDDLNGVNHEKIDQVIEDIRELNLKITNENKFSNHHYELY